MRPCRNTEKLFADADKPWQDDKIKQHEGKVMTQMDPEEAREEVAKMAKEKEKAKASTQQGELKEEVEKLRQGMHQILESVLIQGKRYREN